MTQTVCVIVSALDRERLEAIGANRNRRQKRVERARIVLASADRGPVQRVAWGEEISGVLRKSARHSSKYGIDDTWTGTSPGTIRVKRDPAAPARQIALLQLGIYSLVGGICFCIDVGGFVALRSLKLPILTASVLSFVTATFVNSLLCCGFVFRTGRFFASGRDRPPFRYCPCRPRPQ
jgi:hypothetical protein